MRDLDKSILKELDHQRLSGSVISSVMNKLNTNNKKYQFLSYMISKRNTILSIAELFNKIKEIN